MKLKHTVGVVNRHIFARRRNRVITGPPKRRKMEAGPEGPAAAELRRHRPRWRPQRQPPTSPFLAASRRRVGRHRFTGGTHCLTRRQNKNTDQEATSRAINGRINDPPFTSSSSFHRAVRSRNQFPHVLNSHFRTVWGSLRSTWKRW